jgi:glycosyltransferase involved in cell wall biosynthesis
LSHAFFSVFGPVTLSKTLVELDATFGYNLFIRVQDLRQRMTMCQPAPSVLYTAFDVVPSPKGASTHISHFSDGLVAAGYQVQLLTAGRPDLPAEGTYRGARIRRILAQDTNFMRRAVGFSQAVANHLASHPPYRVVHFRGIWGGLPAVAAQSRLGHRTLFEVNGLPSVELKYHYPALKGSAILDTLRQQEQAVLSRSDRIVCPSRVTAEYIRSQGIPAERIVVIPNGVDTSLFAPQPDMCSTSDRPTLLYLGTLSEWQGIELLLSALPQVLASHPIQLRIVGRGRKDRRKALQKRIRKLGLSESVTLDGAHPHHTIPQVVNQAVICIAPLGYNDRNVTQGCCPIKLLEYLACRRPVVAANLPVVRELVRHGVEALLFTPDDPDDLAVCLRRLLDDTELAERLATNGYRRVRRKFTWDVARESLLRVYSELL